MPTVYNPRLDPYRHRAARFELNSGGSRKFYVQPDVLSTLRSGHLWWKRWAPPEEFVILWVLEKNEYESDDWILPVELDSELDDWGQGTFRWKGETHQLTWLDEIEAQAIRRLFDIEVIHQTGD